MTLYFSNNLGIIATINAKVAIGFLIFKHTAAPSQSGTSHDIAGSDCHDCTSNRDFLSNGPRQRYTTQSWLRRRIWDPPRVRISIGLVIWHLDKDAAMWSVRHIVTGFVVFISIWWWWWWRLSLNPFCKNWRSRVSVIFVIEASLKIEL